MDRSSAQRGCDELHVPRVVGTDPRDGSRCAVPASFAGGLAGLYSLRPPLLTRAGVNERMRRLKVGVVAMALVAWLTVITGTWIVYPWYREESPTSAKSKLLADSNTADWHDFAMEWKEHVAWISPILATVVAFIVVY